MQHLTVFENSTSGAPEVTRASEKPILDLGAPTSPDPSKAQVKSSGNVKTSATSPTERSASSPEPGHARKPSTVDLEMNFTNVITPSYRSVPLLMLLRQTRDKKYFGDGKQAQSGGGISDSLSATMARHSNSAGPLLKHSNSIIPEEMRLTSRDLVKEHVRYYINEQRNVFGELTLVPTSIIFEPALDDPVTRQLGLLNCQFQCDLKDVLDVHVIEASEVLGWWKSRAAVATPSPPTAHRTRSTSMNQGPSSNHLSTGSPGASPVSTPLPIDRFEDEPDRSPRFLQLTVMLGKPSDGTQTGKIIYFLINRQSIDLFYQKMEAWCAQAKPIAPAPKRAAASNLLSRLTGTGSSTGTSTSATSANNDSSLASSPPPDKSSYLLQGDVEPPKLNLPSALLNDAMLIKLASALPTRYRHSDWTVLYSTERHGVSLTTFFNKTKRKGPSYLIVEDDAGFRFGAFVSDSWEPQRSYYGTGECFLFTLYPSWNIYPWSQLNEYFVYSKEDTIAVGGGSGKFGLWLDKDLQQGSSAPCDTFLNSTLSCQEDFKPVIVEVWGFNEAINKSKS